MFDRTGLQRNKLLITLDGDWNICDAMQMEPELRKC